MAISGVFFTYHGFNAGSENYSRLSRNPEFSFSQSINYYVEKGGKPFVFRDPHGKATMSYPPADHLYSALKEIDANSTLLSKYPELAAPVADIRKTRAELENTRLGDGGKIDLQSELGTGSVFRIFFPVTKTTTRVVEFARSETFAADFLKSMQQTEYGS